MHLKSMVIAGMAALIGGACSDGGETQDRRGGVATVSGRLESGSAAGGGLSASLLAVGDDGELSVAGSGAVAADGRFSIAGVAAGDGPFVVRVESATAIVGEVIVPEDLDGGDEVTSVPVSDETTVEAEALVSILAGAAQREDVDCVGLMTWIDGRLAASGGGAASIGAAFAAAQAGFIGVAAAHLGDGVSAEGVERAKLEAWGDFALALDSGMSGEAGEEAWSAFLADAAAELEATLEMGSDVQADATAAAGVLFEASLSGSAGASDEAARVAAVLSAHADLVAQSSALAGSSAQATLRAELEAAYAAWFEAAAEADSRGELRAAWQDLVTRVSGAGSLSFDSALGLLVEAYSGGDAAAMEEAVAAVGATAEVAATLRASIDEALAGEAATRAEAIAQAYHEFRSQLGARIEASGELSLRVAAFVEDTASQLGGHGSAVLDIDVGALFEGFAIGGIDLAGAVVGGLGFQSGADGAFGESGFNALIGATSAVLVAVSGDGSVSVIDQGEVGDHGWSFEGVSEASGTLIVELRDATGAITGAVILDGDTAGDEVPTVPVMTQETTVEALVLLELVAGGGGAAVDRTTLELLIDAAIAATCDDGDDVSALAVAVEAAAAVRAELLGAGEATLHEAGLTALAELHAELTARGEAAEAAWADFRADLEVAVRGATGVGEESYQRAQLEAALVFEAVVEAVAGAESELAAASEARARIESAFALEGAVGSAFQGSSFASAETAVSGAVEAFIETTQQASNEAELDAAASAFVDAIIGFGTLGSEPDGIIGRLFADLQLAATVQATLEAVLAGSFAAADSHDGAIAVAIAALGRGEIDAQGVASAVAAASATFDAAIDVSALAALLAGSSDSEAMTSLVTHLALGFHDAAN